MAGESKPSSTTCTENGTTCNNSEAGDARKLIGIDGYWYDITSFIKIHPGGSELLEQFVGKDATCIFRTMHQVDVLKHRKPVGRYNVDKDPATKAFGELHAFFIKNGYFKTSLLWYAINIAFVLSFLGASFLLVHKCEHWFFHFIGAICLGEFWRQNLYFLHDFMHSMAFHDRKIDHWLGFFFGTICMGVNSTWWKDQHFIHHSLTNTVNYSTNFVDPQMYKPIFAQNPKLFPFCVKPFQKMMVRIQEYTFLPVALLVGRPAFVIKGFIKEKRLFEWVGFFLHWLYIACFLSLLPTWREAFAFYLIANITQGTLTVSLFLSHYSKPHYLHSEICDTKNWYIMQIESNMNIVNPPWMDWWHGGINYHIEHHLFPHMPRHNYREASKHIKRVCKQVGIEYDECGWVEALMRTLASLKSMSKHFSLLEPL